MLSFFKKKPLIQGKLTVSVLEDENGDCPSLDFLDYVKKWNKIEHKKVYRFLHSCSCAGKFPINREKFVCEEDDIFAIKSHQIRLYGFWDKDYEFILTNGAIKKQDKANPNDLQKAKNVRQEYLNSPRN